MVARREKERKMSLLDRRTFLKSASAAALVPAVSGLALSAQGATAMTITPFTITVSEPALSDLKERLAMTRWPSEVAANWERGTPVAFVKSLAEEWARSYDWKATVARLSKLPHFITEIDGQPIHFVHVKSAAANATPLLLVHGWPGSFMEFEGLIETLSQNFDLVIPSIPGFGFSGPITSEGWSTVRVGKAFAELMSRLGYERFGIHGGDTGSLVTRAMALDFPERIIGAHVLQFFSFPSGDPAEFEKLGEDDHRRLGVLEKFGQRDSYNQVMGKRPQSIAFALADSPVGQLTWMLELYATFGDFPEQLSRQQILDHATLYWLTGTMGSSANIYFETGKAVAWEETRPTTIPMGIAVFPNDFLSIRAFAERDNHKIVHWSEFERGGHFAALEVPELLAADVATFFGSL
jgi:epoxide hydrolase